MRKQRRLAKVLRIVLVLAVLVVLILLTPQLITQVNGWKNQMETEYATLVNHPELIILERTETYIKAKTVLEQEGALLLNIPHREHWNIQVDGTNAIVRETGDGTIAVDAGRGAHIIEIQYFPKMLIVGIVTSIIVLILLIFLFVKKRKHMVTEDVTETIASAVEEIMKEEIQQEIKQEVQQEVQQEQQKDEPDENDDLWEFMA